MKARKKRRKPTATVRPKPTAVWADVEVLGAQDFPKGVKLLVKASPSEGEAVTAHVMWRVPADSALMFSVVQSSGIPVKKTETGYEFDSGDLVGRTVKRCAVALGKKGRLRVWHPEQLEKILKTGKVEIHENPQP